MKRKKWSEQEEQTLLSKYSDLLNSGALAKLKTREKKFRPIAEHVNAVHHLKDPISFPFKWSWRDVSIKVQNMRHQYLGVKQKIRVSDDEFNWKDGEIHWENFLKYKEVFGDVELETKGKKGGGESGGCAAGDFFKDCCDLGFGIGSKDLELDGEDEDGLEDCQDGGGSEAEIENADKAGLRKSKKRFREYGGLGLLAGQVTELRVAAMRREEKRRERDFLRYKEESDREAERRELEFQRMEAEERIISMELERREIELEEHAKTVAKLELEKRARLERELEDRRWRRRAEERREEEEMEWRERILVMQIEHEKAMMQMHSESCQNQMQILGMMARLLCQFFGSSNDGISGAFGVLPHQVLQNLHHSGGLGDTVKPDADSPSGFM